MPLFELPLQLDDHIEGNSETVISFLTGEEAWGSQEHQPQQKPNGTSPHPQYIRSRTKDIFSAEGFLDRFKKKMNVYKCCYCHSLSKKAMRCEGVGGIPWDAILQERARNAF